MCVCESVCVGVRVSECERELDSVRIKEKNMIIE